MNTSIANIVEILREIIFGEDAGIEIARDLVSAILDVFPDADDDSRFENILHILASYDPEGGEYLFDEKQLREECRRVMGYHGVWHLDKEVLP